jgi:hypothetical protein
MTIGAPSRSDDDARAPQKNAPLTPATLPANR